MPSSGPCAGAVKRENLQDRLFFFVVATAGDKEAAPDTGLNAASIPVFLAGKHPILDAAGSRYPGLAVLA
ncbi:hypothetical protein MMAGJ_24970 [Mycolicibacterium mageritense]|uniref:Uncharacterized protein n=1 Tax=Mycolicibacterium mageritense TaxID=53462 RepID=A0ABN5Y4U1_MYCME|nr:hypothetical protein MMAGJ_24970 [Mycolicibacterium mageritense]